MEIQEDIKRKPISNKEKFTERTTLHGIRYIADNRLHVARRIVWMILMVCLSTWLGFGIIAGIKKHFNYPVSTICEFNPVTSIEFPAVTICNYNQFRQSELQKHNRVLQDILLSLNIGQSDSVDWNLYDALYKGRTWNMTDIAIRTGHQLDDMLLSCTWNLGEKCGIQNFTTTVTDFGVCFTFNDVTNGGRELRVTQAGSSQGLRLRLSTQQDDYSWSDQPGAGFKLFVHPRGEFPLVAQLGMSVSPGFETSITIRDVISRSLPFPYKSNCSDIQLNGSRNYSIHQCWFECKAALVTILCGCRYYKFPGSESICDPKQISLCVIPAIRNIVPNCYCPVACRYEYFDTKMSMACWPSDFTSAKLSEYYNTSVSYIRSNFLEVNIFYDVLGYKEILQVPSYDFLDLQSDVGAYMGLLCGASIITIFEFLDCILVTLSRRGHL